MALSDAISPKSIVPPSAQIALAIAILRSKPAGATARQYILSLRDQVRSGCDPSQGQEADHYLDLVAYWQSQHMQMQQERDQLRSINIKLERSNQLLASQTSTSLDSDPSLRTSKRKSASTLSIKPAKRTKATSRKSTEQAVSEAQDVIEDGSNFLDALGADGAELTEQLFTIHSLCRANDTDPEALCLNLVRTISALGKVIRFVAQHHEQLSRRRQQNSGTVALHSDKSDFATALSVCARAFMSILVGMHKLSETCRDGQLAGKIVSELAHMFKSALNSIELLAKRTAQIHTTQPIPPRKAKNKESGTALGESLPAYAISHLLNSFLGFLDKADELHQKIFDAFLFVLFDRVGRRLYYCTFGRSRSNSIQDSVMPVQLSPDTNKATEHNLEALSIRLEVKALVLILERAMGLAPNHMNPPTGRTRKDATHLSRTLSFKNLPTASKARLSPLAKDRLQRTLVACMYGGAENASDEFLDILTKPMPPMRGLSTQGVAKVKDEDVESWYMEEVWKLVGWDILAREGGW